MSYINPAWQERCILCDGEIIEKKIGSKCKTCRRVQPKSCYFHGFLPQSIEKKSKKYPQFVSSEKDKQDWQEATPWKDRLDQTLCPKGEHEYKEGYAKLYHKGRWTCLAIWDNSVAERGWSIFVAEEKLSYTEMLTTISKVFTRILRQFSFSIYLTNNMENK